MIKFFRHIRKSLIEENKMGKYFKYAVGEILLVVVGILIALQINNWNDQRKDRIFEDEILQQIRVNLMKDKITLTEIQFNFKKAITSSDKILDTYGSEQFKDSLRYWLGTIVQFDRFQPLTNAYEVAKSKGLDLIRNKQLRFLIGTYYDDDSQQAAKSIQDVEYSFNNDWLPILKTEAANMKFKTYVDVKNPNIFEEGSVANTILRMNKDNFNGGVNRIDRVLKSITKIEDLINQELKGND